MIVTGYEPTPALWYAHDENYDGAAKGQVVGWGKTEAEAIADYEQQLEDA